MARNKHKKKALTKMPCKGVGKNTMWRWQRMPFTSTSTMGHEFLFYRVSRIKIQKYIKGEVKSLKA